jgi:hypothetical protein
MSDDVSAGAALEWLELFPCVVVLLGLTLPFAWPLLLSLPLSLPFLSL